MQDDERYKQITNDKQTAINQSNQTYDKMLADNTAYSQNVDKYLNEYQTKQNDIYDKQTQFQVDLQNQNKEKAEEEYNKEAIASKNAYYDFVNPYGVQREIQAQNGLNRSGYSETVKSQAWTTQQNRTAQARATMNEAKRQFDNAIKEAYLNNDTLKAELALKILDKQQEEALRSLNYTTDVAQQRLSNNQSLDSEYNSRYNTLWSQIQQEEATKEAIRQWEAEQAENQRQFNEKMAYQKERDKVSDAQWEKEYALSKQKVNNSGSSGGSYYGSLSDTSGGTSLTNSGQVSTPYYRGTINSDASKYGTFSNGYQPKGISGHGNLSSTGYTWVNDTQVKYGDEAGKNKTVKQTVWKAEDGTLWYWEGRENKYKQINPKDYNW
jgi:hypothetical protein